MTTILSVRPRRACEFIRKAAVCLALILACSLTLTAQPADDGHAPAAAAHQAEGAEAHGDAAAHGGLSALVWPTINFVVLCGVLVYLLRAPLSAYLDGRRTGIRKDLVEAADLRTTATTQLAEIEHKLQALPGEIESLRRHGAEEIAAEEQRIAKQAAAERDRLLEQARHDIDVQVRLAKRELLDHAADLAVQLAGERIAARITPDDQERLVDRYLSQLRSDKAPH